MRKLDRTNYWKDYRLPVCVVLQNGDEYRLVDGYHRFVNTDNGEITAIVGT